MLGKIGYITCFKLVDLETVKLDIGTAYCEELNTVLQYLKYRSRAQTVFIFALETQLPTLVHEYF